MDDILTWLLDNPGLAVLGTVGLLVLVGCLLVLSGIARRNVREAGKDVTEILRDSGWGR